MTTIETPTRPDTAAPTEPRSPRPTAVELIDFDREHGEHSGRKDEAIRRHFEITPARFYVLLARAIRSPEGQAHDPAYCRILTDRHERYLDTIDPRRVAARS